MVTADEVARLGAEVFAGRVRPMLGPADDGKFVAIDVTTGEYEVDEDDYAAVTRLRARLPAAAAVWLERAGQPTAYRMGTVHDAMRKAWFTARSFTREAT